jgi:hypothetical protein
MSVFLAFAAALAGCGETSRPATADTSTKNATADAGKHSGWWCDEHGVPEGECSMCSSKFAKECRAKGDWCDQHSRARSQCFDCEPALKETFAGKYEAKFGKKPPEPTENGPAKK